MLVRRVLRDERIVAPPRRCPECGRELRALPELYWDEDGVGLWALGYYCSYQHQTIPIWTPDLEPMIAEVTSGVDVSRLPVWPEGHVEPTGED